MTNELLNKKLFNLVLFELEKYANNIANHPRVSDESHYADLRTKKAPLNRAIHWYLLEKALVYQDKINLDSCSEEYSINWVMKKFNKKEICQKIVEKYGEYLSQFSKDFEELPVRIDCGLEQELRNKGFGGELEKTFESLNKKYYDNAELSASEYNKFLFAKYGELIFK